MVDEIVGAGTAEAVSNLPVGDLPAAESAAIIESNQGLTHDSVVQVDDVFPPGVVEFHALDRYHAITHVMQHLSQEVGTEVVKPLVLALERMTHAGPVHVMVEVPSATATPVPAPADMSDGLSATAKPEELPRSFGGRFAVRSFDFVKV